MTLLAPTLQELTRHLKASCEHNDEGQKASAEHLRAVLRLLPHLGASSFAQSERPPEVTEWAGVNAPLLRLSNRAVSNVAVDLGHFFYGGGEEESERALEMRSQFELLMDLFRGTEAQEWLEGYFDAEFDRDLHEAAEQFYHEAPAWVPESHWWWHWPRSGPPSE